MHEGSSRTDCESPAAKVQSDTTAFGFFLVQGEKKNPDAEEAKPTC
jgi:hypothetical protein